MRKLLENVMEKRFYNDRKDGSCRLTPTEDQPVCSSGNKLTEQLVKEYLDSIGDNSFYALKYFMAEVLCLVTAILQIVLTDKVRKYRLTVVITTISFQFLSHTFLNYGNLETLSKDPLRRDDALMKTFPILTSCTFDQMYGTGGKKQKINVRILLCCLCLYFYPIIQGHVCPSQQHRPPEVLLLPLVLADLPGHGHLPPPALQTGSLRHPLLPVLRHQQTMGR